MLFSRCFLAHAGSVYKQLLKAKPAGAAGGHSQQAPHGSPAPWHGVWGHRSLCPLPSRWVTAVNKSPKCLLFLSPPFLLANSFLLQCILVVLPSCPGFCSWGHREEGALPCLSCLFPGRSRQLQGPGSGRHFHCIQLGFSSLMIISRAHPGSKLIQPLEFCTHVLSKFRWVPRGNVRKDRVE